MLVPINTDAPVYHYPYATLGLVALNCVVFVLTGTGHPLNEVTQRLVVHFGDGLRPHEWFTCLFVHFGYMHLIGNMIFLWGFGLVIEGKLGWWKYLIVYMAIGGFVSFIAQLLMLGAVDGPPIAGGASGVIFGLLGISLVWAPKNEVMCILLIWFRGFLIDISIYWFAVFYIVKELMWMLLMSSIFGFTVTAEFVHFSGGIVGVLVGLAFLGLKWVDCENWDLIAVLNGTHGNPEVAEEIKLRRAARFKGTESRPLDEIVEGVPRPDRELTRPRGARNKKDGLERIRKFLSEQKATAALAEFRTIRHFYPDWKLDEPEMRALINGLFRARAWEDVIPCMDEYISRFPGRSDRIRLRRASLAIEIEKRPRYAIKLVEQLREETLDNDDMDLRERIITVAHTLIARGIIEIGETG